MQKESRYLVKIIAIVASILYSPSLLAWCAINPTFANTIGLSDQNCIDNSNFSTLNQTTSGASGQLSCNNTTDVTIMTQDILLRGNLFQAEGTLLLAQSLSATELLNGYSGAIFNCYGSNARSVAYRYTAEYITPPETKLISGRQHYQTLGNQKTGNDIGLVLIPQSDGGINTELPGNSSSTDWSSDIGFTNGAAENSSIFSGKLKNLNLIASRALNPAQNQISFTAAPYTSLVFRYYAQDNAYPSAPSYLRINLHFNSNRFINRRNTCGVSVNNTTVNLGVYSPLQISNKQTNPTSFSVIYKCDGIVKDPLWMGMQPTGDSIITTQDSQLIRSPASTSQGVGVAYSDRSQPFDPQNWLSSGICLDARAGYCASAMPIGNGADGWIVAQRDPNLSEVVQIFYARMQQIPGEQITTGTVVAQVNVLVNHD